VARAAARQISFADIELMRQGVRLEPLLEAISKFLDSRHEMIERVRRDLVGGLKKPRKGRRGPTAPQVLRSLVLMRVKVQGFFITAVMNRKSGHGGRRPIRLRRRIQ
jgi:transposase, IS5 family